LLFIVLDGALEESGFEPHNWQQGYSVYSPVTVYPNGGHAQKPQGAIVTAMALVKGVSFVSSRKLTLQSVFWHGF
jgi:hypothetical protein